jgi:hypothetical protein
MPNDPHRGNRQDADEANVEEIDVTPRDGDECHWFGGHQRLRGVASQRFHADLGCAVLARTLAWSNHVRG